MTEDYLLLGLGIVAGWLLAQSATQPPPPAERREPRVAYLSRLAYAADATPVGCRRLPRPRSDRVAAEALRGPWHYLYRRKADRCNR